ncbi:DUF1499 domain-containing protein [Marinobacteraceae bacterium S3BR75-40.1]
MRRFLMVGLTLLLLQGCASSFGVPESGTDFSLSGCTPFLNCVSSESSVFLYHTDPIRLKEPLDESRWSRIKEVALDLQGASLNEARFGYLNVTCYSRVFHFPDFLELLIKPDRQTLAVRSQSMLGLVDFGVNRYRVYTLRQNLVEKGLAVPDP